MFNMEGSKKGILPTAHGITLSKKHCPQTDAELDSMSEEIGRASCRERVLRLV